MPRPTYTPEQIHQFYDRINFPQRLRLDPIPARRIARFSPGLEFLTVLVRYTLCNIPFENLGLHYSRTKTIDIHPQILFDRIVSPNGRGGYCMENNTLFGTVLRSLGFEVMSTGCRVNSAASPSGDPGEGHSSYGGFGHMINIVTIDSTRYMVDVGFGAGGPVKPLPLQNGRVHLNIKPNQSVRLRFDNVPDHESDAKVWIYERRVADDGPFSPCYCFPAHVEFLPADFAVMNHYTSTNSRSFFTYMVLVVKFILSEDGEDVVGETVVMGNTAHRRIAGRKEVLGPLEREDQRVELLEKVTGIRLDDMQRTGIFGTASMIG